MKDVRLEVKPIPVPLGFNHPDTPGSILPRHEFSMGIIAPKGSGKTTVIANLLKFYKGYFHTILVFSPTVASDEKWDWVKRQNLLGENKPLKNWLKKMAQKKRDDNSVVEHAYPTTELANETDLAKMTEFKIPEDCFYSEYNEDTLAEIMEEQMKMVKLLKKCGQSKHMANRILIVFDDLVGSSLFSSKKDNPFKKLNSNHRHYSASLLMVTQAYKEIPKTVRTNFSCLIIFEIPNEKEIEVIFEENPNYLKRDEWMEAYEYATNGDHDFLFINYQKPKRLRLMKNFDQVVFKGK
jgi:hypothetical protein